MAMSHRNQYGFAAWAGLTFGVFVRASLTEDPSYVFALIIGLAGLLVSTLAMVVIALLLELAFGEDK